MTGIVGIDRVILNKFRVENFDALEKKEVSSSMCESSYFEDRTDMYTLGYSYHKPIVGDEYVVASLGFNPNVILKGNNEGNATVKEVVEALNRVVEELKINGIDIDISGASIKYIEINKNLYFPFEKFSGVFLAIGRSNFKKSFGQNSFLEEDIPKLIKKERALYVNLKEEIYNSERPEEAAVILAYDKTFEMFTRRGHRTKQPVTRVELKCGRDVYREEMKKKGLDNSLVTLLHHPEILEEIYREKIEKYYFKNTENYIFKTIIPNLERDFIAFKRTEREKRKIRTRLKASGREIPKEYGEIRGIFEYLKENSWIFDSNFLMKIVKKHIQSKHRSITLKQLDKPWLRDLKNYRLFNQLKKNLV